MLTHLTSKYDFVIFTDGSGFTDGFGGAASLVFSERYDVGELGLRRILADSHTTVNKMELQALINALEHITYTVFGTKQFELLKQAPATVLWFCDRESLVKCVNKEYEIKSSLHLWHYLSFFTPMFNIEGVHLNRDTDKYHNMVDLWASDARVLIKEYIHTSI